MNQSEIRQLFLQKKGDLSLPAIADKCGVSTSTLSKFQRDTTTLDMDNLIKIAAWCGVTQLSGEATECDGNTLKNVRQVIFADESLTDENKEKLWSIFSALHNIFKDK